jgi:hypothetical protein
MSTINILSYYVPISIFLRRLNTLLFQLSVISSYIPIGQTWHHENFPKNLPYDHCIFLIPAATRGWGSPSVPKTFIRTPSWPLVLCSHALSLGRAWRASAPGRSCLLVLRRGGLAACRHLKFARPCCASTRWKAGLHRPIRTRPDPAGGEAPAQGFGRDFRRH